ncbi:MAG: hypothetical protein ACLP8A_00360 [Methylovirgula sp.]
MRLIALLALLLLCGCKIEEVDFLKDPDQLAQAIAKLHSEIGAHPRVLKIEVEAHAVIIEAQEPGDPQHVDEWKYAKIDLGPFTQSLVTGPNPVELTLINPDLEANLFDLDAVDFSAAAKLEKAAVAYAHIADPAGVAHMEISRQLFILPQVGSGDIRWRLLVRSDRERAEIFANAAGTIVSSDLSGTQRAKTLDLLKELSLTADAAAAFRAHVGAASVVTSIRIEKKLVAFETNIRQDPRRDSFGGLPANSVFTWDLDGLRQRLGRAIIGTQSGQPGPVAFSVDDLDWTVLEKLRHDALEKVRLPGAQIAAIHAAKTLDQPGAPQLLWIVDVVDAKGETTSVMADAKGVIQRVLLPASRRPLIDWRTPAALSSVIARIARIFGPEVRIASIHASDRGGQVTIDDPQNGGKPASFDFAADGMSRSSITFSLYAMGPRFGVADLAPLTEAKIAALQADAMQTLAPKKSAYLDSIAIGPHPFAREAGARVIEVRLRDQGQDSAQAQYAWIVYDFTGKRLDFSAF